MEALPESSAVPMGPGMPLSLPSSFRHPGYTAEHSPAGPAGGDVELVARARESSGGEMLPSIAWREACRRKGTGRGRAVRGSRAAEEYTEERFTELARFLFARTDPVMLSRPVAPDTDRAVQALNDTVRALLAQARAYREWGNEPALAGTWDALTPSPGNGDAIQTSSPSGNGNEPATQPQDPLTAPSGHTSIRLVDGR
jgi:hypothetical protein